MTFEQLLLICFGAASVIHGAQTVLVAKLWRHQVGKDRHNAFEGLTIGVLAFLWQFGNFCAALVYTLGFTQTSAFFRAADFVREGALVTFPLVFSYICL